MRSVLRERCCLDGSAFLGAVIIRLCNIECNFAEPLDTAANAPFQKDMSNWARISNRTYIWNYIVRCLRLPSAPLFLSCLSIQFCRRTELNLAAALSPLSLSSFLPLFLVDSKRRRHWTESGVGARRQTSATLFRPSPTISTWARMSSTWSATAFGASSRRGRTRARGARCASSRIICLDG